MDNLQLVRCASGSCFKDGTLHCAKCKVTFYCSKTCQKKHWTSHKKHCSIHEPLPKGTFEFLKLNRDIRNKVSCSYDPLSTRFVDANYWVYENLVVARFTPDQQTEYDSLIDATGDRFSIRNLIDQVEGRLTISPGMPLWDVKGYQSLVDARGLLNANHQINQELTTTLFTKNTFLVPVGYSFRFTMANQLFSYKLNPSSLAQIKHLIISVGFQLDIEHPDHSNGVASLKHNFNHIVESLNYLGNNLETLKIRFISCFAGRVEEMRGEIDPLLTQPNAPPVQVMRQNGTVFTFTHRNVGRFYRSGFDLGDAFKGLNIPVKDFKIHGDLPGKVIERLNRKFRVAVDIPPDEKRSDDQGPIPATPASAPSVASSSPAPPSDPSPASSDPTALPRDPTGQSRNDIAEFVKSIADKNPGDKGMMRFADQLARMPIRSREVKAMLYAPPTPEEMEMIRRQMQK